MKLALPDSFLMELITFKFQHPTMALADVLTLTCSLCPSTLSNLAHHPFVFFISSSLLQTGRRTLVTFETVGCIPEYSNVKKFKFRAQMIYEFQVTKTFYANLNNFKQYTYFKR